MLFQSKTLVGCVALVALSAAVLVLAIDHCEAGRGGGRGGGGGGGFRGGGGGFGGGARVSNGFHHRPSGGGSYQRPGAGYGGGAHVDNSLPGRPGHGRPDRPNRPDRPDRPDRPGGGHDKPGGGGGGDNNYYVGWDNPPYGYGYGVATGLAIGTYVYSVAPGCVHEQFNGLTYRRCDDVWYQPLYEDAGVRYVVVRRPY